MITKAIKISEEQERYLLENYKNVNQGIQACISKAMTPDSDLETLRYIRTYSRAELSGKFSQQEWYFFFDSLNGSLVDGMFRCNAGALVAHCEDAEKYDHTATKYKLDLNVLASKVQQLSGAQIEALYTFVEEFWNDENRDLEVYSKVLA